MLGLRWAEHTACMRTLENVCIALGKKVLNEEVAW